MDLDRKVERWRLITPEEHRTLITVDNKGDGVLNAKLSEIENWRQNKVFEEVDDVGQSTISVRWVVTQKRKEGRDVIKARLVARGFEETLIRPPVLRTLFVWLC